MYNTENPDRPEKINKTKSTALKKCKVCGIDLGLWGDVPGGICPRCIGLRKGALVPCAGKCGKRYQVRVMSLVTLFFEPGHKGGQKFSLRYCPSCLSAAKARARAVEDDQQKVVKELEQRIRREATGASVE